MYLKKRYLLLGSTGFLGSKVKEEISKICFNNRIELLAPSRGEILKDTGTIYDLSQITNFESILEIFKPTTIINCSAKIDFENINIEEMNIINNLIPSICASYCKRNSAHLVNVSTVAVYEADKQIISLNNACNPETYYGKTKLKGDLSIINAKIKSIILRFPGIWGLKGPNHLGINLAINNAINKKSSPTLIGDGLGKRNYIFVKDAAKCIVDAALHNRQGIFICAPREYIPIKYMLSKINSEFMNHNNLNQINAEIKTKDKIYIGNYNWIKFLGFEEAIKLEKKLNSIN
tara:strand:+ start:689 stop:1561 length:873 start_codon:yes stop_codon:yes gene_type:complete